jgi:hypothetical protein
MKTQGNLKDFKRRGLSTAVNCPRKELGLGASSSPQKYFVTEGFESGKQVSRKGMEK